MTVYAYDEATRRITFTYDAPYPEGYEELLEQHGIKWIIADPVNDIPAHYVNAEGQLVEMNRFSSTASKTSVLDDGEDSADWSGLPEETEIRVDGVLVHTGSSFSLCSDEEGSYEVLLTAPGYVPQSTTILVRP